MSGVTWWRFDLSDTPIQSRADGMGDVALETATGRGWAVRQSLLGTANPTKAG
ncbi:hypothetical protein [Cryobacterium suzukii]|uniref:hypothetical protein n=1 Tax=Cryobacterium suzukii TaxID=1259198 RepID=UPI00141B2069|nr:hypothetical protein [Cryobacterium suzukii]